MKIEIDIHQILSQNLSANQYVLCFLLYSKNRELADDFFNENFKYYRRELDDLFERRLIVKRSSVITKTDDFTLDEIMFTKIAGLSNPSKWIDEWFDLWPQGVRSGGYYVRTDRLGCLRKLKSFAKRYPEYSEEIILKATKAYLDNLRNEGYAYVKLAPNFIEKNGVSTLAGECQSLLDASHKSQINSEKETKLFGEREL